MSEDLEFKNIYAEAAEMARLSARQLGSRSKFRNRDSAHKAKAIAKRRKKNKNKKTHRK